MSSADEAGGEQSGGGKVRLEGTFEGKLIRDGQGQSDSGGDARQSKPDDGKSGDDSKGDSKKSDAKGGGHDNKKSYKFLWIFGAVVLVIGIGVLIYHLTVGRYHVKTKDAYVNGYLIRLAPQVSGTVMEITTDQTQPVVRGQLLVRLDPHDTDVCS